MNGLSPSHFALLEAKVTATYYDAIAISETKINPLAHDSHLTLDGFNFFHVDREGMGGGGVGLYVRDTYSVDVLASSDPHFDNTPEYLICEIKKGQLKLLFAAIYRRPHAAYPIRFFDHISTYLPHFTSIIITGDFNINMALPSSPAATHLAHSLNSNSLYLVPSDPTHHQLWRQSHTWIDLFIVRNASDILSYSKSDAPFIAGHDFTQLSLACTKPPPVKRSILSRDLKNVKPESLCQALSPLLSTLDYHTPFSPHTFIATSSTSELVLGPCTLNVDDAERALTNAFVRAFDAIAPLRKIILSSRRKPWVNAQIRALMQSRDRAYRLARASHSPADIARFRALRSQASNALDSAKNRHIASRLADAPSANAKWREIRQLRVTKANLPSPLDKFSAHDLNSHFAATVNRHPPLTQRDFDEIAALPLSSSFNSLFCLRPVTDRDVAAALLNCTSSSMGHDGLSAPMIKLIAPHSLPYITNLFNVSIASASFPAEWKRAIIKPLAKTKVMLLPSDTRPIALLPELSKVLERLVHSQLQGYLETNRILHPRQAGFRHGHSTQTALLGVFDDVRQATDERMLTFLILFDFSKAFDSIPHTTLLAKLRAINVSTHALRWFFSYLADRLQAVIDSGGTVSDWLHATSGVPQGSVLGPLLFAVFINDLPSVILFSKIMIFADDTQLYYHFLPSDFNRALERVTRDAQAVANWARVNGLLLNSSKTKIIILGSVLYTRELDLNTLPRVIIDGHALPYVSEARSLGVTFTNSLDWQVHARLVTRKVYGTLFTLRFFRHALSRDIRKHLVEALVFPHFDYAAPVYNHLDKTRFGKLEVALNACVRFVIGNIPRRGHVTPHRLALGWLSAARRREYAIGIQAFKIVASAHPPYLTSRFNYRVNVDLDIRRSTRHPLKPFEPPARRTEAFKHSFALEAMELLNSMCISDFSETALPSFKRLLRSTLFARDVADWNLRVLREGLDSRLRYHSPPPPPTAIPLARL